MALVRMISTARLVYLTAALFLVLAIMSCTSSSCQAGNCIGSACRRPWQPPPNRVRPCFRAQRSSQCGPSYCKGVCAAHGINNCKAAFCEITVVPHLCCCPHFE
ncbi:hypothetical protein SEVIR_8G160332v4 [Setaria viridis]